MVINHTDCGLMQASEEDLRARIQNRTGTAAVSPAFFYAFQNIDENVRQQIPEAPDASLDSEDGHRPRLRLRRHHRPPPRNQARLTPRQNSLGAMAKTSAQG